MMDAQEFNEARQAFGMGRREFARLLGYTGSDRNNWITVKRYENGERDIPPTIERLVRLLVWHRSDFGYLPDLTRGGERVAMVMPGEFVDAR